MKTLISKGMLMRVAVGITAVIAVLLMMPMSDHQSYSYELNQPWRYPLLTADFDIPIMRDSVSARQMRDSIDAAFVPFVERDPSVSRTNLERFVKMASQHASAQQVAVLTKSLSEAYGNGIVSPELYDKMHTFDPPQLRMSDETDDLNAVRMIDASSMLSPKMAYRYVDSVFERRPLKKGEEKELTTEMAKALNICISPNIVVDTVADTRFRDQEYLNVNSALGVIKKGQRIVDRGEIVDAQIYMNLGTYLDTLERSETGQTTRRFFLTAQALYTLLMFTLLYLFMWYFRRRDIFSDFRRLAFVVSIVAVFAMIGIEAAEMLTHGLYIIPFAAVPIIIAVFTDSRMAIFAHIVCVLLTALIATFQFQFIVMEIVVGVCATFSIYHLTRRSQLLRTALVTFVLYVVCYTVLMLLTEGTLMGFSPRMIGVFGINAVLLSFAYILILVIEKIFGFTSTVTLVELSDINNPVLRHMAEVAPGTFQHSMQVSTLASEAARAIGANTTLVRTGALYHDIGKSESPVFFTENQHGVNPHAGLDPATSARKIISHVTEGLAIASREKLPQVIKDFIAQHHGKGVTKYFYNTAVNESPDGNVDKADYQYPGPNPNTKETTILMMADSIEAASRSLKDYSTEAIDSLVDRIIDSQMADGLYEDSPISFRDLQTIKDTFKKRLATIYHSRIEYPEIKKREEHGNDTENNK